MLDTYDYLYIVCTTIIKTIIIFICGALLCCLIAYNHSLGISWADNMGIPYDMALTVTSLGFVNNIMVVFTVFDLIIFGVIVNKLNKYKTMNRLFNRFYENILRRSSWIILQTL